MKCLDIQTIIKNYASYVINRTRPLAIRQNLESAIACALVRAPSDKLQKVKGSVCFDCYALKGCYVFKVVQEAQYRRLAAIKSPDWVQAMAHLINSKKPNVFRWHDSGDVQDLDHLKKIYAVCRLTPEKRHWLPTREAWIKDHLQDKPDNLVIRFSAPMVNQAAPASWPNSSEVSEVRFNCPASLQDNECRDCRKCWDPKIKTIIYRKH